MKIKKSFDKEYGNLLWMTDGKTEIAASLDYGVRIMVIRAAGMENLLYRQPDDLSDGLTTEKGWRIFGGHRFWASPESALSYYPDKDPVSYAEDGDGVILTQKADPWTGFEKRIRVSFTEDGLVEVKHTLKNCNDFAVKAAAWGVSSLKGGGNAVVPYNSSVTGAYTPRRVISLWGNASLCDERLKLTDTEILVEQKKLGKGFKMGTYADCGRISMTNLGQRFEITFKVHPLEEQPDNGCNLELYTDDYIMELETVGALTHMEPGECTVHTEFWRVEKL